MKNKYVCITFQSFFIFPESQKMYQPNHPQSSQIYCSAPNPFNGNYFSRDLEPQTEVDFCPEEGYLPPDPALYNFYSPEQQFMQPPQKPRYTFLRRINKMNWDLLNSVDVSTIARNGETASAEG